MKLRLAGLSKLEDGLVDSGLSCNLIPDTYCVRNVLDYQTGGEVQELKGFNGSRSAVLGRLETEVRIGRWTGNCKFLVSPDVKQIIQVCFYCMGLDWP